jgi:hypothetical protein
MRELLAKSKNAPAPSLKQRTVPERTPWRGDGLGR